MKYIKCLVNNYFSINALNKKPFPCLSESHPHHSTCLPQERDREKYHQIQDLGSTDERYCSVGVSSVSYSIRKKADRKQAREGIFKGLDEEERETSQR